MPRAPKSEKEAPNLLTLLPCAKRGCETDEKGNDVVLVPKFKGRFLGRWLMARLRDPYYRLHLDDVGTHVWRRLDGKTKVQLIGESLKKEFGDRVEPVYDRLGQFLHQLEKGDLIDMPRP